MIRACQQGFVTAVSRSWAPPEHTPPIAEFGDRVQRVVVDVAGPRLHAAQDDQHARAGDLGGGGREQTAMHGHRLL